MEGGNIHVGTFLLKYKEGCNKKWCLCVEPNAEGSKGAKDALHAAGVTDGPN